MRTRNAVGRYGEDLAARYLTAEGFVILERNWRCELGEIDIVARDGDALVVCEVKTRRGLNYGSPLESITYRKLTTLRKLAGRWLQTHQLNPSDPDRHRRDRLRQQHTAARGPREGRGLMPRTDMVRGVGRSRRPSGRGRGRYRAGLPKTTLIGLPDASLSEARDRVRAAVVNSGERFPDRKVTIGLSPATLPKTGSHYDVAIACALLTAAGVIETGSLRQTAIIGELGLDGRIREVRGASR